MLEHRVDLSDRRRLLSMERRPGWMVGLSDLLWIEGRSSRS
jgi:hypothetical protein